MHTHISKLFGVSCTRWQKGPRAAESVIHWVQGSADLEPRTSNLLNLAWRTANSRWTHVYGWARALGGWVLWCKHQSANLEPQSVNPELQSSNPEPTHCGPHTANLGPRTSKRELAEPHVLSHSGGKQVFLTKPKLRFPYPTSSLFPSFLHRPMLCLTPQCALTMQAIISIFFYQSGSPWRA